MFGKLNDSEMEDVLKHQYLGRLGCHADGITYVVPVSYAYDGVHIYVRTFDGMKVEMMRKNPKVCFQADQMENMANWKSVVLWGVYEELTDPVSRTHALQQLLDRNLPVITSKTVQLTPLWPFSAANTENISGIVFRIRIDKKTGRYESNSASMGIG